MQWLKTVLSSGTLSDKVAALTLLVQESPVHTLASLDSLLAMAAKKGKRESILAIGEQLECDLGLGLGYGWGFGGGGGGGARLGTGREIALSLLVYNIAKFLTCSEFP